MRFLPFRILVLSILLPPVAYILTILFIESQAQSYFQNRVERIYLGDTKALLEGDMAIQSAIERNMSRFLQRQPLIAYGIHVNVVIRANNGSILYPVSYYEHEDELMNGSELIRIARQNYKLLAEGLRVEVEVEVPHNTVFSNFVLSCYLLLSLGIITFFYRSGVRRERNAEAEKNREIDRLARMKTAYTDRLVALARKREEMQQNYERLRRDLQSEKIKASKNEDELIDEIVKLEAQIENNVGLQEEQQAEIESLKEVISTLERDARHEEKSVLKAAEAAQKRFKVLYKNVIMNKRAIDGYVELSDDLRIKSEEIVHQLNEDAAKVKIKRKVFHKNSRETVFEVIFGYRGRLYFRKNKDNRVEVLSIGNKNTQSKDLTFLDRL